MACLVITSGEQTGTYFQLTKRPMAGGRDPATEIQLIDDRVSRRHFQIRLQDESYVIRELRSKNGVFVNGRRIEGEQILNDEDQIKVGNTEMAFFAEDNPERTNAIEQYRKGWRSLREDRTLGD